MSVLPLAGNFAKWSSSTPFGGADNAPEIDNDAQAPEYRIELTAPENRSPLELFRTRAMFRATM
ncbi:MAG: hypothetical protein Q9170_002354 [Blastenia crenularia]